MFHLVADRAYESNQITLEIRSETIELIILLIHLLLHYAVHDLNA